MMQKMYTSQNPNSKQLTGYQDKEIEVTKFSINAINVVTDIPPYMALHDIQEAIQTPSFTEAKST